MSSLRDSEMPDAVIGILDQALLAAVSFIIIYFYLRYSDPTQYGIYLVITNFALLIQAIQAALILTPMQAVLPALQKDECVALGGGFRKISLIIAIIGAFIVPILLLKEVGTSNFLLVVAAAYTLSLTLRLQARAQFYSKLTAHKGLKQTVLYCGLLLTCLGILKHYAHLSTVSIVGVLAISSIIASLAQGGIFPDKSSNSLRETIAQIYRFWTWTLIGAGASWLQSNIYLLAMYLTADLHDVGVVGIGRVFLLPVSLVFSGLGAAMRPHFSRRMSNHEIRSLIKLFTRILLLAGAFMGCYFLIAGLMIKYIPVTAVPTKYVEAIPYVSFWLVDSTFVAIYLLAAIILVAAAKFRSLALITLFTAITGCGLVLVMTGHYGTRGILFAQLIADAIQALVAMYIARKTLRFISEGVVDEKI